MKRPRWTQTDRQHYADHNILRSWRIPNKPKPAPNTDEWDTEPHPDDHDLEEPTP